MATPDDYAVLDISDNFFRKWSLNIYSPLLVKDLRPPLVFWKTTTKTWTWTIVLDIGVKVKNYHWTFTHLFRCWRCLYRMLCWIWVTKSKTIIEHLLTAPGEGFAAFGVLENQPVKDDSLDLNICVEYPWQNQQKKIMEHLLTPCFPVDGGSVGAGDACIIIWCVKYEWQSRK